MGSITVRRMGFAFPEDIPTVFIEGEPEESYSNLGLSLLLPYVEPYLIRSLRAAKPRVQDPALAEALDKFCAQEGQHYKQHARFNEVFRGRGFDGLATLEAGIRADYERFSARKSLRFNLAYAEGFEALTTALSVAAIDRIAESGWHPAARDLFLWHLVEELEHRNVAFDVYEHVFGSYLHRVFVAAFAQFHLLRFMRRVREYMIEADPATLERHGGVAASRARVKRLEARLRKEVVPGWLRTYLPAYTPHAVALPPRFAELAARFDREALGG
jgi:predicted metal-dependent hydrolase